MKKPGWIISALISLLIAACAAAQVLSPPGADDLLKKYRALPMPQHDPSRMTDLSYAKKIHLELDEYATRKNNLARQIVAQYPDHPQSVPALVDSWNIYASVGKLDLIRDQAKTFLAEHPASKFKVDVMYIRAAIAAQRGDDRAEMAAAIDQFITAAPNDQRVGPLLLQSARSERDITKRLAAYRVITQAAPNSPIAKIATGLIRQIESIGKPFELNFTDAISGREVSLQKDMKGKVVIVDFWATWCGPCITEEMPILKKIYAEYHAKGVEIVGVSLDEPEAAGGLATMKKFVAENNIAWPQFYQGKTWESDFSSSWGVFSLPSVFVVDADGKLAVADNSPPLDKIIPELLAKRDAAAPVK
jgi:thiol-disulfide isomerase/thioredoxin